MDVEAIDTADVSSSSPPPLIPSNETAITATTTSTMPILFKLDEPLPPALDETYGNDESLASATVANTSEFETSYAKFNGDSKGNDKNAADDNESDKVDSSDCDALVIDEKPNRKRIHSSPEDAHHNTCFKRVKSDLKEDCEFERPSNPYFHESIFDLSGINCNNEERPRTEENSVNISENINPSTSVPFAPNAHNLKRLPNKKKKEGVPKLREYAQYLGLQPAIQFKCSKCFQAGFPSLSVLNEHHIRCTGEGSSTFLSSGDVAATMGTGTPSSTNFRVTRKVYLCSACGTYYENWNLFMHMLEMHKRFICLYCLGMFSKSEKLSAHLSSKHNCVPNHLNSEEDFYRVYKDPCYVMCCECDTVFNENENFFGHICMNGIAERINNNRNDTKNKVSLSTNKAAGSIKKQSVKTRPEFIGHVTGDTWPPFEDFQENPIENKEDAPSSANATPNVVQENNTPSLSFSESNLEKQVQNPSVLEESSNNAKQNDKPLSVSEETTNHENKPTIENNQLSENENSNLNENKFEEETSPLSPSPESPLSEEQNVDDDRNSIRSSEFDGSSSQSPAPEECENSSHSPPATVEDILNDIDDFLKENNESMEPSQTEDTRKVPKVTLKLPKLAQPYIENGAESDFEDDDENAEKETDDVEQVPVAAEDEEPAAPENEADQYPVAGSDISIIELKLEQPLDKFDIRLLLQKCLKETISTCVYCNYARKIAVNGKQLGLHAIAQHRFSAVVNSITAEELIPESFVQRIKECLEDLEKVFFSIESNLGEEITFSHIFECFQCRYSTTVHKELYLHNRKMHAKTILLCVMCKSNFYSYSELICHLCPGVYETQDIINDISFRCCMCITDDLPSAFRLMVHLRKRHNACDVCLELCHNQSRLSNHVWKHKLHHFCYRCGVAYRNKPDITKHLFWKHGTESVLCKKCLQKKWPHVYHFCIPPSVFACEECNQNFTRAVALRVHKRLHRDTAPHACTFENCTEKFISKKLLLKHEFRHRELPEEEKMGTELLDNSDDGPKTVGLLSNADVVEASSDNKQQEEMNIDESDAKTKVDESLDAVYNLPELNLSESSDSEDEKPTVKANGENYDEITLKEDTAESIVKNDAEISEQLPVKDNNDENCFNIQEGSLPNIEIDTVAPVLENIWDDFKNYQANKAKSLEEQLGCSPVTPIDSINATCDDIISVGISDILKNESSEIDAQKTEEIKEVSKEENLDPQKVWEIVKNEHDYCVPTEEISEPEVKPNIKDERSQSIDHDYCFSNDNDKPSLEVKPAEPQTSSPKLPASNTEAVAAKPKATESSDDSDSSSCGCDSNCSCSSSSDSSSSSSDESSNSDSSSSEGRRKQLARREKRRQAKLNKEPASKSERKEIVNEKAEEAIDVTAVYPPQELQIEESDLYTSESETDEDFYDQQPQKLAYKMLAEKRKLLLAELGSNSNSTPFFNGSLIESSRPSTPSLPEAEQVKLKKKSKSKKKKKKNKKQSYKHESPPSYRQVNTVPQPAISPITLSLPKNSPCPTLVSAPSPYRAESSYPSNSYETPIPAETNTNTNQSDSNLRASKRRRIPNKFYGYSSDEDKPPEKQQMLQYQPPPMLKWRKADLPSPARRPTPPTPPSLIVPPLTIKKHTPSDEFRTGDSLSGYTSNYQPQQAQSLHYQNNDSASDSNDSSSDEEEQKPLPSKQQTALQQQQQQPGVGSAEASSSYSFPYINNTATTAQQPLYCYCRCPYDEVSEMIGCDNNDCSIEWFHFECVGIMVPPKGAWYCPDCRKKKQASKERQSASSLL